MQEPTPETTEALTYPAIERRKTKRAPISGILIGILFILILLLAILSYLQRFGPSNDMPSPTVQEQNNKSSKS